jgi:CRISPR-associated endonuclease/helicase Cas3
MEKISAFFETNIEPPYELISHPDRSLREHLGSCNAISELMLALKYINANTFYDAVLLENMRHLLVYFHDFGKGSFFQLKIIKATECSTKNLTFKDRPSTQAYLKFFNENRRAIFEKEIEENDRLGNHAKLGGYFVLPNFQNEDIILSFILLKIIRRHHGNLNNFFTSQKGELQIQLDDSDIIFLEKQIAQQDFEAYQKILNEQNLTTFKSSWEQIKTELSSGRRFVKIQTAFEAQKEVKYFFVQHFLFSLLLSADKGDMMLDGDLKRDLSFIENHRLPLNIINNYKDGKHKDGKPRAIDIIREEAYNMVADNAKKYSGKAFFSITLPTGLGKTYAAYNVAVTLQNAFAEQTGKTPRIIYVLPFTSIIDQNEAILREIMSNTEGVKETWLSKNHYLSDYNKKYDESELMRDEPEYLADGWEHDVIVTTFVQFLEGIFTDRNRLLRKFHNMTNAVFILDEVQNIPPQYFEVIELVFKKMNEYFNTKFVFVTATQPFLFKNADDVQELADPKKYFQGLERITLDQTILKEKGKLDIDAFSEILIEDIETQSDKSFLIICNTIKSSQTIYQKLTDKFGEVLYLSSSILPFIRIEVINQIKNTKGRQLVVSTQVVEAGVDIDLDIVYRDFAPMDSINQSAGRCNRNGDNGGGFVKLFDLDKAQYIYDTVLTSITAEILRGYDNLIPEAKLYDLNLAYAKAVRERKAEDNDKSAQLIKAMCELRTEDIARDFKLIKEDYRNYNVFIPVNDEAKAIWQEYKIRCGIEDDFERKRKIKEVKPQLLQYVTRFPKDKFETKSEASIIYVENWKEYYDLKTGFKNVEDKTLIV